MGEPHSTVSSPLSDQQCAHEGRNETCTEKATQGKDTEGQMLSKQFEFQWVQWESIGDPAKHLNCVM